MSDNAKANGGRRKMTDDEQKYWSTILLRAVNSKYGQPALAYAFFSMKPWAVDTDDPNFYAAIDPRFNVYLNMKKLKEIGIEEATGIVSHEPWHVLRRHSERFANLDRRDDGFSSAVMWNIAADATINTPLGRIGEKMAGDRFGIIPSNGVFIDSYPEWKGQNPEETTEVLYHLKLDNMDFCADCGKPVPLGDPAGVRAQQEKQKNQKQSGKDQKDQSGDDEQEAGGDQGQQSQGQDSQNGQDGQGEQSHDHDENGNGEQNDSPSEQGQSGDGQGQQSQGQDGQGQDSGSAGQGSQPGQDQGSGSGHSHACDTCGQDQDGQGNGSGGATVEIDCGSGAGGPQREWELPGDDPSNKSEEEIDQVRKQVASDLKNQNLSRPGSVPGSMLVWADQELAPVPIDYRKLIRGQLRAAVNQWRAGKVDYNRKKPSRRQVSKNIIFPKLEAPTPRIGVGIDVSGSMMWAMGVVVDQVCQIAKQCGVRGRDLLAFPVDVRIGDVHVVNDPRKVLETATGGGGTDMSVGIEQLHKLYTENRVDIAILITDLETPWPKERPADNCKYIVVGVVNSEQSYYSSRWVEEAEAAIGDWAEIVVADVAHDGKRK